MNDREGFMVYLKGLQFSEATLTTCQRVLGLYLAWAKKAQIKADQVCYEDLLGFMKSCRQKGITQRTIQHYLTMVTHYYNYLVSAGRVSTNPALGIEVKGIKRRMLYTILEPDELHEVYHRYPTGSYRDRRNKLLLGLLVYQGLRTGELSRMATSAVQLRVGKIEVLGSRKHNGRLLALEPHQVLDLHDYLGEVRPALLKMRPKRRSHEAVATDRLLIAEGGCCYSLHNLLAGVMRNVRLQHPRVKSAQQIRASVITQWVKRYNLRKAQYLAGHRYISSTESYVQNDLAGLQEDVQQFHPLG